MSDSKKHSAPEGRQANSPAPSQPGSQKKFSVPPFPSITSRLRLYQLRSLPNGEVPQTASQPKPNESVFLSPAIINFPNKRISHTDVRFFVELESPERKALVADDWQSNARLLAHDFLGVYKSGFAGKSEHVGQLSDGPTVSEFTIEDARVRVLSEGLVLLVYRAEWIRIPEN